MTKVNLAQQHPDYILIAGLPRSGSTLMQSVLRNSSCAFTLPETHFFEEAVKISSEALFGRQQVLQLLALLQTQWQLSLEHLIERYRNYEPNKKYDICDVYFQVIEQYRPLGSNDSLIGIEKTPGNIVAIESIIKHPSKIKIILTCRNPVDFANSMVKQYWAPESVSKISLMWNNVMQSITALEALYPQIVKRVEYERMVKQPEKTFSSACDFTGLQWNSEMLNGLNTDLDGIIVPKEYEWKRNNLNYETVKNTKNPISLTLKQRLIIHKLSFIAALKSRYLNLYRF